MSADRRWREFRVICSYASQLLYSLHAGKWMGYSTSLISTGWSHLILMPQEFLWMLSAKPLQDAWYPGMKPFMPHPRAWRILALLLLLIGLPEIKSVPRHTMHRSRIKRGHTTWICRYSGFNIDKCDDRLQECINVERRHLPGKIFHT